ncbi:tRNA (adenosine(37)-N6)-threonylcarbamoyltransferase complex transferase subunit TsaD [Pelagicoccus sp. SDUM812003]|uniref:tRNA (adenosine(37)-N6)-threonylcarbamoyltransferase complex transferase subunit TsaD n=1 Tax=Pelagicoccus sp. SDUM812003 TaxID=3041267 RepID=UPI00280ED3AD|nr:tRNA (adenosine(37)-N6)-threonylcarbamoyltransferase complex transferase subunit TsaD [Pelagicoccus sp. SDUM812003]MDQ8203940.1 tRNA (adenosine(37)-N6)-threonylcarbamoyltransferase complex transferase subunit TsaD [Pelagicoccus sp. SDUM812003]
MLLAIESSCDESALALFEPGRGLVGEWISSQVSLHAEYGGVVPDLASREHLNNFGPLLKEARSANGFDRIDEIAVTTGPGLAACLAMGLSVAKALAVAWQVPVYGVNHLRAHAHSPFLPVYETDPEAFDANLEKDLLPHLSLVVSGGNTLLARIDTDRSLKLLGSTIDDAAGEALDKGAKLLALGYPGGPKLEKLAAGGDAKAYGFPRALMDKKRLDFSFSGLKTSLRYQLEKMDTQAVERELSHLCSSYQEAVVDALIRKTDIALKRGGYKSIGLSGGVSNNGNLRHRFEQLAKRRQVKSLLAQRCHTGDNAGMIAFSHVFEKSRQTRELDVYPALQIEQLG